MGNKHILPIKNRTVTYHIKLDKFNEAEIRHCFGYDCFLDISKVKLATLSREINPFVYHHAWLIIFVDNLNFKYATIGYSLGGIILNLFSHELKLNLFQVCSTIIGERNTIQLGYLESKKNWGQIVTKLFDMKKTYSAEKYTIFNNCERFFNDLREFLLQKNNFSSFSSLKYINLDGKGSNGETFKIRRKSIF